METNNLLAMKAAFIAMSSMAGWEYFCKFAEAVIRDMEKEAIAEDDDARANGLRRDARGARKFWDDLRGRIELAKSQPTGTQDDPSDEFYAILEKYNERQANA